MKSRGFLLITLFAIVSLFVTACGAGAPYKGQAMAKHALHEMPAEVQAAPPRTLEAYQVAFANPEIIQEIPCYCGCNTMGHKNNYDCYVKGIDGDGPSILYDAHALGCGICVDITQDVMRMYTEGKTVAQMKKFIDTNYAKYGPSTEENLK